MAVSLGGNIRTIWITIRAVNYTQKVFNDINTIMKLTIKTEKDMVEQTKNLSKAAMDFISAGTMMVALSVMIGVELWNLAASSEKGAADFAELTQNLEEAKSALADSMYEILKATGVLTFLNNILNFIKANKWAQYLVLALAVVLVGLVGIVGVLFLFNGLVMQASLFSGNWMMMNKFLSTSLTQLTGKTTMMNMSLATMSHILLSITAGFMVFFALQDALGPIPAALIAIAVAMGLLAIQAWMAAGAMSVVSWGAAAIAGGAALAGAMAIAGGVTGFQMGTRSVPYTGPVMAHEGEVIYNPSTNRPLQVGNDLAGGSGQTTTIYQMPMEIKELHTKADVDELDKYMRLALRRSAQRRK
jgi:hypothetical protein